MIFPEIFQVFIVGLLIFPPVYFIYKKAGFNPVWSVLVFLPGFGLLLVFMQLALLPWPSVVNKGPEQ
jgi:hypothetical protein